MSGFIIYIFVSIFTPGPNNIFSSISASRIGFKKTQPFMLGIFLGTFIVFTITGLFNVYLYENAQIATKIIGIIGGLFIIYLAVRMFYTRNDKDKLMIKNDKLFLMAIILNFANAKTLIFGLTVATYYLNLNLNPDYMIYFAFLMGLLCYISVIAWGLLGQFLREFLNKYRTIYNIIMALLLGYSGVLILIESI